MRKLVLLSLTLVVTICFVISGLTLAFFTDREFVGSSVFEMGRVSLTSANTFSALDDPYSYVKQASWTVQNTGSMDLVLRVNVNCAWDVQGVSEVEAEAETETEVEGVLDFDVENELKELPTYVVTLPVDLWSQDGNGWYVYRKPVFPNETIHVDAEISVIDPGWQGDLKLYFEAEADHVDSGGS